MQEDRPRAIGFFGHHGVGKTTLLDTLAHRLGVVDRPGRVDAGTSLLDSEPESVEHRLTAVLGVLTVRHEGVRYHLVDAPGYLELVADREAALAAVETAVVVVDAAAGLEVGAEQALDRAQSLGRALMIIVNRLDRPNARFFAVLEQVRARLGAAVVPAAVPDAEGPGFGRVASLLGTDPVAGAESWYDALTDLAAESDDAVLERYLDGQPLSAEERLAGLAAAFRARRWVPVLPMAGLSGVGLDVLLTCLPLCPPLNPGPGTRALVFKTRTDPFVGRLSYLKVLAGTIRSDDVLTNSRTGQGEKLGTLLQLVGSRQTPVDRLEAGDIGAVAKTELRTGDSLLADDASPADPPVCPEPRFAQVVIPAGRVDEDKVGPALGRLLEEDPGLRVEHEGSALLVVGQGEFHLQLVVERLKRKFGVTVSLANPPIPYRETIRAKAKAEGKHKKQTGGHGQYGHVWLEIEPLEPGAFEFVDRIFGGVVPQQYRPAVEKGIREAMAEGVLAGYPVTGVRAVLVDGSYHPVDSSELAFKIAGALAFKKAVEQARPVLLEPIGRLEVAVPRTLTGDVIGDLNRRRAHVLGVDSQGAEDVIHAEVPLAEVQRYAVDLRALSQGRGRFELAFDHYQEAPPAVAQKVTQARQGTGVTPHA
ncbi:MAG: elongation factor G [Actinomycetia bacterium]|nr:elongation factor G [Actinomycetes bacterium]